MNGMENKMKKWLRTKPEQSVEQIHERTMPRKNIAYLELKSTGPRVIFDSFEQILLSQGVWLL
jgi:hypothetical protein